MKNKTQTMEVVSITDPAIDLTKTDLQEYANTRDLSLVVSKQGEQCTKYYLKPLSTKMFNRFIKSSPPSIQNERAFALSVVQVDNLAPRSGECIGSWIPRGTFNIPGIDSGAMVEDEELELFWPSVVEEIGSVAYRMSFLPRTSGETWRLPPSLQEELTDIFQNAARIRRDVLTSKEKPQEDSQAS